MGIERGLLVNGRVIPGTEFIIRDSDAWWDPKVPSHRHDLEKRAPVVDTLVGHWTAGPAGTADTEDDGLTVFRNMQARKSKKYDRSLRLSIGFIIAADDDPDDCDALASIWQCMDIGTTAAIHVGKGWVNRRSIGVEVVNVGFPTRWSVKQKKRIEYNPRNRPVIEAPLLGRDVEMCQFFEGQLLAWRRLAECLAGLSGQGMGIEIPRQVPALDGELMTRRRMTVPELRKWKGGMEHFHMHGTTKVDAGGMLVRDLHENCGWELRAA
jgi:hypothetical protein